MRSTTRSEVIWDSPHPSCMPKLLLTVWPMQQESPTVQDPLFLASKDADIGIKQ
ncbi:MAG TPA: hypothetical protein VK821_12530 [Dehalococcoidia bacterium]|nr:hypothetical protein [Dehalococcoidia bacterium]